MSPISTQDRHLFGNNIGKMIGAWNLVLNNKTKINKS